MVDGKRRKFEVSFDSPFALVYKESGPDEGVLYLRGSVVNVPDLTSIPRPPPNGLQTRCAAMIPYATIRERGFHAVGDEPIVVLQVEEESRFDLCDVLRALPSESVTLEGDAQYNFTEQEFAAVIASILKDEIHKGEGSNFVTPRRAQSTIRDFSFAKALSIYRQLLEREYGAYMVFFYFDGSQCFVGATPERQLTVTPETQEVRMNPIAGTFRKKLHSVLPAADQATDFLDFLADEKEINELFMCVDEELKMMSRICREGGEVVGPLIKEMPFVIHTEYELVGSAKGKDPIDLFRSTMFCPTVLGSPLGNAARVVSKYESGSRSYYSGAFMLWGHRNEMEWLDSCIAIRTLEISKTGLVTARVGATLVRDSKPESEVAECNAKLRGVWRTFEGPAEQPAKVVTHIAPETLHAKLQVRNQRVGSFWLKAQVVPAHQPRAALLMDNEDDFVRMLAFILEHLGYKTEVEPYSTFRSKWEAAHRNTLVVIGPGPGDPNDESHPKMRTIAGLVKDITSSGSKVLGVCLGHQFLCKHMGFEVCQQPFPTQGVQKTVDVFGAPEEVAFYNSFCPRYNAKVAMGYDGIETSLRDDDLLAVRIPRKMCSVQFHPESVLTRNNLQVVSSLILPLEIAEAGR
mmetsp:Transcript_77420/g.206700  ORF Transcript_77420/g.206700 Transcript_77420/m.206700 type:complete len:632 (+) Transcript_77420:26-1921(+)